ncbi:MAG TPA: hypothetical protein VFP58_01360, partial [Candidatus Eisenbacteria bacterium]|nr:hypothetical protein [Candidatus Eisenbacteria bacterium]
MRVTTRWDAVLEATPYHDELRLRSEKTELLQIGEVGRDTDLDLYAKAVIAKVPPIIVSREGEYLRVSGMDEYMGEMTEFLTGEFTRTRSSGSTIDSALAAFPLAKVAAGVEANANEHWNLWMENWVGLEMQPGREVAVTIPQQFGPITVPVKVSARHLGTAALDSELVWLEFETTYEGDAATKAFEGAGRQAMPEERTFRSIRRVDHMKGAFETRTARPSYARFNMEFEVVGSDGSRRTMPTTTEYFFEWIPPLGRTERRDPMPDSAVAWYRQGRLQDVYDVLWKAAAEGSRNPEVHAYLGEIYRYWERPGEALASARRALALDARSGFAHQVMADVLHPRYGFWYRTNADSGWAHLMAGIACDSTDENLWLDLYLLALERGRTDLAQQSLRTLMGARFFTLAALAYARWMVQALPQRSLLVTNGDMDTYPLLSLQEVERLRPDVAVVHTSLLRLPWYVRHIRDRYGVALPWSDAQLDSLASCCEEPRVDLSARILEGWADMKNAGKLETPMHVSITVPPDNLPSSLHPGMCLVGATWEYRGGTAPDVDTTAVRLSLEALRLADLRGPIASPRHRSPVVHRSGIVENPVWCRLRYAEQAIASGRRKDAEREIRRARSDAKTIGV